LAVCASADCGSAKLPAWRAGRHAAWAGAPSSSLQLGFPIAIGFMP
jgi:hypothetical protein